MPRCLKPQPRSSRGKGLRDLGPGQRRGRQSPAQEGGSEEQELNSLQPGQRHGAQATRKTTTQAPPTSIDTSLPGVALFSEAPQPHSGRYSE